MGRIYGMKSKYSRASVENLSPNILAERPIWFTCIVASVNTSRRVSLCYRNSPPASGGVGWLGLNSAIRLIVTYILDRGALFSSADFSHRIKYRLKTITCHQNIGTSFLPAKAPAGTLHNIAQRL